MPFQKRCYFRHRLEVRLIVFADMPPHPGSVCHDGVHGFTRMVRDAARTLGKEVRLDISGESTLVVNLPNRTIVLPGDTVHLRAALDQEATMGLDVDPIASVHSLKRIKALRDMTGATVWITHDPDDWKEHPHKVE